MIEATKITQPKINFDDSAIRILYARYRQFMMPLVVILVCIFLFFQVIVPQINDWFLMQEEEAKTVERIEILKSNLDFLAKLNTSELDIQFNAVSSIFPSEKDFIGVLDKISFASVNSGVKVGDFSFYVGDITAAKKKDNSHLSISVLLDIEGNFNQINSFLNEFSNSSPISEVKRVQIDGSKAKIDIVFYYGPTAQIMVSQNQPIKSLSPKERLTLDKISEWKTDTNFSTQLP